MAEDIGGEPVVSLAHKDLPFRLVDIKLEKPFPPSFPLSTSLNAWRKEWHFQYKLLRHEWRRDHYVMILFGIIALSLGSISSELWSGGDAKVSGMDGVLAVSGFQFFQILISLLCWSWFTYQAWVLFPVMRIHAISLLVMWNGMIVSEIFFHRNNAVFPLSLHLSQMMEGTLILLIVFFFLFFFWKAVVETRDLHVEVHHLHEDVRVMEAELAEHSLRGWSALFVLWLVLAMFSSWAGVHHIAEYGEPHYGFLILHLLSGIPTVPLFVVILWYPQRMLANQERVRTRAAVDASLEMEGGTIGVKEKACCPQCESPSAVSRNADGHLIHPCLAEGCSQQVVIGSTCSNCNNAMPTRIDCPSCALNAPAIDFLPDHEAW